jgi:hypothetical protein
MDLVINAIRGCIQKFPDWPPGVRTASGTAPCHQLQLYRYYSVSQSSEFCRHKALCCFSTSVYCCKRVFRYRLSPETFGYTLVRVTHPASPIVLDLFTIKFDLKGKTYERARYVIFYILPLLPFPYVEYSPPQLFSDTPILDLHHTVT